MTGGIFEEIKISWKGKDYSIPPDRVMGLIERIEDVCTMEDLQADGVKRVRLAKAFQVILNYAGANPSEYTLEKIYNDLFKDQGNILNMVFSILKIMIPPEHLQPKGEAEPDKKKGSGSGKRKAKD